MVSRCAGHDGDLGDAGGMWKVALRRLGWSNPDHTYDTPNTPPPPRTATGAIAAGRLASPYGAGQPSAACGPSSGTHSEQWWPASEFARKKVPRFGACPAERPGERENGSSR